MLKLGLVGQHITKSLTQTFFQELSEIYNIELSYDLFDLFNQNISIEKKLKELSDKGYKGLNITYAYTLNLLIHKGLVFIDIVNPGVISELPSYTLK